jgi:hypothetical protein
MTPGVGIFCSFVLLSHQWSLGCLQKIRNIGVITMSSELNYATSTMSYLLSGFATRHPELNLRTKELTFPTSFYKDHGSRMHFCSMRVYIVQSYTVLEREWEECSLLFYNLLGCNSCSSPQLRSQEKLPLCTRSWKQHIYYSIYLLCLKVKVVGIWRRKHTKRTVYTGLSVLQFSLKVKQILKQPFRVQWV